MFLETPGKRVAYRVQAGGGRVGVICGGGVEFPWTRNL